MAESAHPEKRIVIPKTAASVAAVEKQIKKHAKAMATYLVSHKDGVVMALYNWAEPGHAPKPPLTRSLRSEKKAGAAAKDKGESY